MFPLDDIFFQILLFEFCTIVLVTAYILIKYDKKDDKHGPYLHFRARPIKYKARIKRTDKGTTTMGRVPSPKKGGVGKQR